MKSGLTGFIGAGNMATALVKGLVESGLYGPERLMVSDIRAERLREMREGFGVKVTGSNTELVRSSSVVVLSVKPQVIREILEEVRAEIRDDHLVISIAAGIPLKLVRDVLRREL
jgi:pyrroline-5-carboxylate reductase